MPNSPQFKSASFSPSAGYAAGFAMPERAHAKSPKGLTREVIESLSTQKQEPAWMLAARLNAFEIFKQKPLPAWGGDLSKIDFDDLYYYVRPDERVHQNWNDVPADIKETFDRLGVPEAEKQFLAGSGAQYDSEAVYHNIQKHLTDKGVIFLDTDTALKKYPELFKEYFGTVVPPADNKFSALNSAVWSGGSFIYIPKCVRVELPLQAYFRINTERMGQFERTLIIADEGSYVHYVEGCFIKGTRVVTQKKYVPIEDIKIGDKVLTHKGRFKKVYHIQKRPYTGDLYSVEIYGDATQKMQATAEHPFLTVRRTHKNERNTHWKKEWKPCNQLTKGDYLLIPINQTVKTSNQHKITIPLGRGRHGFKNFVITLPSTLSFFRLVGYYLAEGSVSSGHYLNFSFHENEREYINEIKKLLNEIFPEYRYKEVHYQANHSTSIVVNSTALARVFVASFGKNAFERHIPIWMLEEQPSKQRGLIHTFFNGDGNYYCQQTKYGRKEIFRLSTVSPNMVRQLRDILLRLGIVGAINCQKDRGENRRPMYNVCIGGEQAQNFGMLVEQKIKSKLNKKKRATMFYLDTNFAYVPIKKISHKKTVNKTVYNFSVRDDESYIANNVAVHNCTAPAYTTNSLHSAVVEIVVKRGARVRYTTIQNWSKNVYNLVTKRAYVYADGLMEWVDGNLGSALTMKYPSAVLLERGARGTVLSLAMAGKNQHQDAGGKVIHVAPYTSSMIISKSVSYGGGRASYRGLVKVAPKAEHARCFVSCDALILDAASRADTYPTMDIRARECNISHEASVSKIGEEQLFYLQSRGLDETQARSLIVNGFLEPIVKELPMEYAVELNRLIQLEMQGAVG
ncbi:MAG TPA: Fe-S cluster assembly protein SufB [Candidatus Magasanikbacteria bacterium]|nr:Fe-S cluster assembly protein SufB [Candidatus Magasanikbacteria bacterium]